MPSRIQNTRVLDSSIKYINVCVNLELICLLLVIMSATEMAEKINVITW